MEFTKEDLLLNAQRLISHSILDVVLETERFKPLAYDHELKGYFGLPFVEKREDTFIGDWFTPNISWWDEKNMYDSELLDECIKYKKFYSMHVSFEYTEDIDYVGYRITILFIKKKKVFGKIKTGDFVTYKGNYYKMCVGKLLKREYAINEEKNGNDIVYTTSKGIKKAKMKHYLSFAMSKIPIVE